MAVVAVIRPCNSNSLIIQQKKYISGWEWKGKRKLLKPNWQCGQLQSTSGPLRLRINNQLSTYSSRISTDISLLESPQASFDQYLEDKPRVFKAMFPDNRRSQQLNDEEWRLHMLPIQFFFLTSTPVIDMRLRCKSGGIDYPPGVPSHANRVLDLDITKWELRGLEDILKPSSFSLEVKGCMYPDRQGNHTRLKGQLIMSISLIVPPVLAFIPEEVRRDVANTVLKGLVENMKQKVNGSLLADYSKFKKEKAKEFV